MKTSRKPAALNRRSPASGSYAPTLDQLLSILSVTRSEIVAVARRSKAGRMGGRDMDIIQVAWTKLKQKKWLHLQAEYFALVNEGAQQAIAEVNPMAHNSEIRRVADNPAPPNL